MGICYSSHKTPSASAPPDFNFNTHFPSFLAHPIFSNASTPLACLHTQQGKKGTNQDAMILWENFYSGDTFVGVFDGHGPYGHMVARKVRDALPLLLRQTLPPHQPHNCNSAGGTKQFDDFMDDGECDSDDIPESHIPFKNSIKKAFKLMDKELKFHPTIDCFCSGTTAVALIKQPQDLIIGNVGDSRAVLATRNHDNTLDAIQLTVDLKPNLPREAARIHECKGRVFALQDEPEVARVWLPNSDTPGLAMARAFGDFCLKDFGLISMPDVCHHHVTESDEFVILATDGVWDVLSNKEAVDIVASAPSRETAARAVIDCATRAWRLKYPTSKIDDCAVVCVFLDKETKEGDGEEQYGVHSGTRKEPTEVVAVVNDKEETIDKSVGRSKRSLGECISTAEDEEWSALEGITRVNSLLSIPRFMSLDRRSLSWRKWL